MKMSKWVCTCKAINPDGVQKCHDCGMTNKVKMETGVKVGKPNKWTIEYLSYDVGWDVDGEPVGGPTEVVALSDYNAAQARIEELELHIGEHGCNVVKLHEETSRLKALLKEAVEQLEECCICRDNKSCWVCKFLGKLKSEVGDE